MTACWALEAHTRSATMAVTLRAHFSKLVFSNCAAPVGRVQELLGALLLYMWGSTSSELCRGF